ncbi:MAG: TMEM134 family protein [Spirochaetaceae bacterium]|jgi:hypothetical protein|nr:TMEM134 family protein [Spirochaetaceae bacterium]
MNKNITDLAIFEANQNMSQNPKELKIIQAIYEGKTDPINRWPLEPPVKERWNSYLSQYELLRVKLEDTYLDQRILNYCNCEINPVTGSAHTIFLVMGNRKFVCFLIGISNFTGSGWIYEFKPNDLFDEGKK